MDCKRKDREERRQREWRGKERNGEWETGMNERRKGERAESNKITKSKKRKYRAEIKWKRVEVRRKKSRNGKRELAFPKAEKRGFFFFFMMILQQQGGQGLSKNPSKKSWLVSSRGCQMEINRGGGSRMLTTEAGYTDSTMMRSAIDVSVLSSLPYISGGLGCYYLAAVEKDGGK